MSQWRIGDVTITKIVEQEVSGGSRSLLPRVRRTGWPHICSRAMLAFV